MIRFIRTSTLTALRTEMQQAEETITTLTGEADSYRTAQLAAEAALTSYQEAQHGAERRQDARMAAMEHQLQEARADTDHYAADATILAEALDQLQEQLRRAQATSRTVYVLVKDGIAHSAHLTREDAKAAAEREGAHHGGWESHTTQPNTAGWWVCALQLPPAPATALLPAVAAPAEFPEPQA